LRNHTANHSAKSQALSTSIFFPASRRFIYSARSLAGFASLVSLLSLLGLAGASPSALAAEPSVLPQSYSAKIVDTASLTSATASSPASVTANTASAPNTVTVAPVVSMLPVPSTKPDPAAAAQLVPAKKKKVKKRVAPTTSEAPLAEEALALPANKIKLSKTPDTKAPEAAKENSSNSSLDAAFAALRKCESGGNYKTATGNGYYGAYQFDPRTWRALGYSGLPSDAAPEVQDEAARKLLAKAGWGQWPACSRKLGLR
jgi:Transglycosylase-like domain